MRPQIMRGYFGGISYRSERKLQLIVQDARWGWVRAPFSMLMYVNIDRTRWN